MGQITDDARKMDELVYEFSQADSAIINEVGPWGTAYRGFCLGMAVRWLALRQKGEDFRSDPNFKMILNTQWEVSRDQTVYANQGEDAALAQYGLKFSAHSTFWTRPPRPGILVEVASRKSGLFLVSFMRPGAGHALYSFIKQTSSKNSGLLSAAPSVDEYWTRNGLFDVRLASKPP